MERIARSGLPADMELKPNSVVEFTAPNGGTFAGFPLFAACVALAFIIQWLVFIHAWTRQTERYFDLTGSLTYLCLVLVALTLGSAFLINTKEGALAVNPFLAGFVSLAAAAVTLEELVATSPPSASAAAR